MSQSNNPKDWTFAIAPYHAEEPDDEAPMAFISPKSNPDFDQEITSYLPTVFDGLEAAGLEGYESMECHLELTNDNATDEQLRNYLLSLGMTEKDWPE